MSGALAVANPRRIKAAHRRRRKVAVGPIVQRYYDPGVGRFLSVDPVTANGNTGGNFNRYWYANNNPYKFVDPDGRFGVVGFAIGAGADFGMQMFKAEGSFSERLGQVDVGDVLVAGAVSAIIPGMGNLAKAGFQGAKVAIPAAKAIAKVGEKSANTVNRAAKNTAAIARNVDKVEGAAADVGKATVTAGAHQLVKAVAQSETPEVKVSDVRDAVPPPPPPEDMRRN